MQDVMGIINLHEGGVLPEFTTHRPLATVPFGGRYRLIDFVLSSMVNSGVSNVGVLVQQKYRSLVDHLRSGREWDLSRKKDGLAILPPHFSLEQGAGPVNELANFYRNLDYLTKSREQYALITGVNMVLNIDYRPVLEFHRQTRADVTVLYKQEATADIDCANYTSLVVADNGRVRAMTACPQGKARRGLVNVSMEMFIMAKELLTGLVKERFSDGKSDFVHHCLSDNLDRLKVYGFAYTGYLARIHCLSSYFKHNMDLLNPRILQELFYQAGNVYTKTKDEGPARYGQGATALNSLVAGGATIGGTVENSVIFRGVTVDKGARVKNSIIMQNGYIAPGATLEHVICDKDVRIMTSRRLAGEIARPLVISKGTVIE